MSIASERTALKAILAPASGLTVYAKPPGSPSVPCAILTPQAGTQDATGAPFARTWTILLLASTSTSDAGFDILDTHLDDEAATSVLGLLLDADDTLGAITWDQYGTLDYGALQYTSVQIHAELY